MTIAYDFATQIQALDRMMPDHRVFWNPSQIAVMRDQIARMVVMADEYLLTHPDEDPYDPDPRNEISEDSELDVITETSEELGFDPRAAGTRSRYKGQDDGDSSEVIEAEAEMEGREDDRTGYQRRDGS